jgi:hypothetical protein
MSLYNLEDQPFKLLDESIATYKDLKIPCSARVNDEFLEPLENEIAEAFSKGYEGGKGAGRTKTFPMGGKLCTVLFLTRYRPALK